MERICITKRQCKQLIENELFGKYSDEDDIQLNLLIKNSKTYFDTEIIIFNYFLSKLLEQYSKQDAISCKKILELLQSLKDVMYLTLEEFDFNFINNLMTRCMPHPENTLEEDLLELRTW